MCEVVEERRRTACFHGKHRSISHTQIVTYDLLLNTSRTRRSHRVRGIRQADSNTAVQWQLTFLLKKKQISKDLTSLYLHLVVHNIYFVPSQHKNLFNCPLLQPKSCILFSYLEIPHKYPLMPVPALYLRSLSSFVSACIMWPTEATGSHEHFVLICSTACPEQTSALERILPNLHWMTHFYHSSHIHVGYLLSVKEHAPRQGRRSTDIPRISAHDVHKDCFHPDMSL